MTHDTECTDLPVCPHCGHVMRDAWELDFGTRESVEVGCGSCGEEYVVQIHVATSYTTAPTVWQCGMCGCRREGCVCGEQPEPSR